MWIGQGPEKKVLPEPKSKVTKAETEEPVLSSNRAASHRDVKCLLRVYCIQEEHFTETKKATYFLIYTADL